MTEEAAGALEVEEHAAEWVEESPNKGLLDERTSDPGRAPLEGWK